MTQSGKKLDELVKETNLALNNLNIWFRANKLSLSIDKTSFSFFSPNNGNLDDNGNELTSDLIINDSVIKRVNCCKYLGMYVDEKLSWINHIDFIKNKLLKFTGIFYKMRSILPFASCKQLYFALVHPHIVYGVELYANTNDSYIDPLVKMNNKILRILQNKKMKTPVIDLYKSFNTLPVQRLHELYVAKIIQRFVHNCNILPVVYKNYFCTNSLVHTHDTRRAKDMHIKTVSNRHGYRTINQRGCRIWNSLTPELKQIVSIRSFGKQLKKCLQLKMMI
jgi:hypothetical protein